MPTTIKLKNSVTTTNVPSSLAQGEVAINVTDKKVWVGNAATTPVQLLGTGSDGSFTNISVSGVASFADGTVSLPSITNIGDTNTGMYFPAADTIAFAEGGTEVMRIDSTGQVGIGGSTAGFTSKLLIQHSASEEGLTVYETNASGNFSGVANTGARLSSFQLLFNANGSERMRISSAGNVGIGTSTPLEKLDVLGIFVATDANRQFVRLRMDSAVARIESSFASGASGAYRPLAFSTSDTERMRIDTSGNVGVGVTTNFTKFDVSVASGGAIAVRPATAPSNALASAIRLYGDGTSTEASRYAQIGCINGAFADDNSLGFYTGFSSSITERMRLNSSGNLGLGVTPSAWNSAVIRAIQIGDNNGSISSYTTGNTSADFLFLNNNAYYDGSWKYASTNFVAQYALAGGEHRWYNAPSGTANDAITLTQAMTLDTDGDLGVGTTGPSARLSVDSGSASIAANFNSTNASGLYLRFQNSGTSIGDMGAGASVLSGGTAGDFAIASRSGNLVLGTGSTQRMIITSAGGVEVRSAAILGYGTGAGGTVTQATSKSTTVTLSKPCGTITMNNAALAAGASVNFQVSNNLVSQTDTIVATTVDDFGADYTAVAYGAWDGYFYIRVTNQTGGSLSQAVRINFTVLNSSRT